MKPFLVFALLMLGACAATKPVPAPADPRYLTAAEDAHLKAICQPYEKDGGCAIVPAPVFGRLLERLKACMQEHSL